MMAVALRWAVALPLAGLCCALLLPAYEVANSAGFQYLVSFSRADSVGAFSRLAVPAATAAAALASALVGAGYALLLGLGKAGYLATLKRCALCGVFGVASVIALYNSPFDIYTPVKKALDKYDLFEDDKLEDKNPAFDAELIDSRPFGDHAKKIWQVNASAAVLGLDVDFETDASDPAYSKLYPSYAAAAKAWRLPILPSLNAVEAKAKRFDDGLSAALYQEHELRSFLPALLAGLEPGGPAHAWVAAGIGSGDAQTAPESFFDWTPELRSVFRTVRYFQKKLPLQDPVAVELSALFARDAALRSRYAKLLDWFARFDAAQEPSFLSPSGGSASLLPSSRMPEDLLFQKVFEGGLPEDGDLMLELVKAIRSGRVDLKPGPKSGWYEYQVYALETFLLPERGAEAQKLLLTKRYKKRMLRAFATMMAKKRETHPLLMMFALGELAEGEGGPPSTPLPPRLRVEPNPTYFLRMARSYAFLEAFLGSQGRLRGARGLKEDGRRALPLLEELTRMKELFYGLHLVSCEDLGMSPQLLEGEAVDEPRAVKTAEAWLADWLKDEDMAADTRVAVPIAEDLERGVARYWGALGVHGARLTAHYARRPKWRRDAKDEWRDAETIGAEWIILVDEPAEFESRREKRFTRAELRAIMDREGTKEKILEALR